MTNASNGQEKLDEEVKALEKEIEDLNNACTTAEACKAIAEYVTQQEAGDALLTHNGENKFLTPPSSGAGCCVVA